MSSIVPEAKQESYDAKREKQADVLISLACKRAEFWHSPDSTAFADIRVEKHRETWPLRSRNFKLWLNGQYYKNNRSAPNTDAVQNALNALEAQARFDGHERSVNVRIAGANEKIYIDLGTPDWSAIEIDADGWRIVSEPPVRFRRSRGLLPLPWPKPNGDIKALRPFLNVQTEEDFALIVAFLVAVLRGRGPFVILVLTGEHGTAKSTLTRLLRTLCDPNSAPLRSLPREDRDLFISANNGYVLAFDNVSTLSPWLSDSLARLATGGGFSTRELYTDSEEVLFDAMRPIILNGIEDFVTRGDLADRVVGLMLMEIRDDERRDEASFWGEFDRVAPVILGGLLDAVAYGLKKLPDVNLARKPRMADFAKWGVACEGKLPWAAGTFMRAYERNRAEAVETLLETDSVVAAMRALLVEHTYWKGTAGDLLKGLNTAVTEETRKGKDWPKSPRGMSGALRRCAPGLRKLGYAVDFLKDTGKKRNRWIELRAPVETPQEPSEPSEPFMAASDGTFRADGPSRQPSVSNALNNKPADGADGSDGREETLEEAAMDAVTLLQRAQHAGLRVERAGDKLVVRGPRRAEPVVRLLAEHKAEVLEALAATPCFAREVPPAVGEPSLEQSCDSRRGRIQFLDGAFLHFCVECGRFGAFGYGVHLSTGRLGRWYCGEHRPQACHLQIDQRSMPKPPSQTRLHRVTTNAAYALWRTQSGRQSV